MKPALLVLAAGMGSRYGGLKQIEPMGPHGETLPDYAVFDALRAGFAKVVFVIRRDIETDFRKIVAAKYEDRLEVCIVHQELHMLPASFSAPRERSKPWGTAHATLQAAPVIGEPFAVINADDFYGRSAFAIMADFLGSVEDRVDGDVRVGSYANVGYVLRDTLSDHGTVVRGVCRCNDAGMLEQIVETHGIEKVGDGARTTDADGRTHAFTGDEIVSLNFWGFTPSVFTHFESSFERFLDERGDDPGAEFFLPTAIDDLIGAGLAEVRVLHGGGPWFGVTYPDDAPLVRHSIKNLVDQGEYPSPLWEGDD
jgi:hypothetical protein